MMKTIVLLTMFLVEFLPTTGSELGQCKLPMVPTESLNVGKSSCWSFGNPWKSRLEYNILPTCGELPTKFSFQFRSPARGGVLFYVNDEKHIHLLSLVMSDGHLRFAANCDSRTKISSTNSKYNDGKWHSVLILLSETQITLLAIDSEKNPKAENVTIFCNTTSIDDTPLLFVGGITEALRENDAVKNSLTNVTLPFKGYIRNATQNYQPLGKATKSVAISPCYDEFEHGIFFPADGGYITAEFMDLHEEDIKITMKIKPRSNSGVFFVMTGGKELLLHLQIVDGGIKLSVYNGEKEVQALYVPSIKYAMCDGQWHSLSVSLKANKITLRVDNSTLQWKSVAGVYSAKNFTTGYLGGYPYLAKLRGSNNTSNFVGCIDDIQMNPKPKSMTFKFVGKVNYNTCPTI